MRFEKRNGTRATRTFASLNVGTIFKLPYLGEKTFYMKLPSVERDTSPEANVFDLVCNELCWMPHDTEVCPLYNVIISYTEKEEE